MRFNRLDLIKYGKFSDRSIEFPKTKQDFHIIVGPNEAGKSTMRSAILDLLFGIPRNSPLDFLHPLSELRLGASISNKSEVLEFHRTKAQKQTLRSPLSVVLPDTALTPFLGTSDRNFFDQMFGLDHTRLVKGGNSILSAENDVGQVLFQSAAGVASLGKIRDELITEAEKLWGPRKSADRAYYIAADQLEKATATLKDVTVRTKVWAEANTKVETLQESLTSERDHHQQLQSKRSRLERVRRLAPYLLALKENEIQLAELGDVVDLPIDAASILATAERGLATARQLLDLRNIEVEKATDDLGTVHVDEAVIAIAADISNANEIRLQYSAYDRDIENREKEVATLWREICDACVQLDWKSESEDSLTRRLPTLLVRRELGQLAREHSGLKQALRATNQAEITKLSDIKSLSKLLAELESGEVKHSLRAALASAKSLGDPDSAIQKQQGVLAKAQNALEGSLHALGKWSNKSIPDLKAMQHPSQQTITRLVQDRQSLIADQKTTLKLLDTQKAEVASIELEITQFNELHHPMTHETVVHVRGERDALWVSIKNGVASLKEAAPKFEDAMCQADIVSDTRLDNVGEVTELQSKLHQLEKKKQSLLVIQGQCTKLNDELQQFDARWIEQTTSLGLADMKLEDIGDWLVNRGKVLAAVDGRQDAQDCFDLVTRTVSEFKCSLAGALREMGEDVAESESLSALCIQAESIIHAIDEAKVRHETLSDQLSAAQILFTTLKQTSKEAEDELNRWTAAWKNSLTKAGLPIDSDIGTVEGALELIGLMEEKLEKMRQIRVERIDAMNADLKKFAAETGRLAQMIAPELQGQPSDQIAQKLANRLAQAHTADVEAGRLKEVLRKASEQVVVAKESIQSAEASIKPLMERAGVTSNALLAEAITRSDEHRHLKAELTKAKVTLLGGGDGLTREQIEGEVDTADLAQVAAELTQIDNDLSIAVQRQTALSADHANALRALNEIGGSDAAAKAEGRRQEAISQMSDVAERYVKVFTAGRMLRWSIDRYREEKQGPLLTRASAIFSKLTLGSFQRLVVDFDKEPMVLEGQRWDTKLVGISGMSDGARDQLYLALRLAALELHLEQAMPLPFIADDLFINYDDSRAKAGLEAFATLSERTQVIFLSHHDHLVPMIQEIFGKQINVVVL
jgi:uncharacterized protein YhaN